MLDDTVGDCIRFGDEMSARFAQEVDAGIVSSGYPLPPLEDDPADQPHPDPASVHSPERLDLRAAGIGTVVWATGARGEFGWLPPDALDDVGEPIHAGGVSPLAGLYCLGFPWLTRRGSGIIAGVAADAEQLALHIVRRTEGD